MVPAGCPGTRIKRGCCSHGSSPDDDHSSNPGYVSVCGWKTEERFVKITRRDVCEAEVYLDIRDYPVGW